MPGSKRSAEWLRGAVESHINTCNLITSITSATKSHPARQGLMAAGNELHNQLDRYRSLLTPAEAREAGEPSAAEVQKQNNLRLLAEWKQAEERLATAAERALGTAECYLCIYENEQRHRDNWEGSEDQDILRTDKDANAAALALIARWKEAHGGK